jgi:hypothetical protein
VTISFSTKSLLHGISIINSMEQRPPSEANNNLASYEIPRLLRKPKFHCRVQKSPPLGPILNQIHSVPVHIFPPYFLEIHSSNISSLTPRFSGQNFVCISHLSHTCFMPHTSHSP